MAQTTSADYAGQHFVSSTFWLRCNNIFEQRDSGLFGSIKEDLTTLIHERQELLQRKELATSKLIESNRWQKDVRRKSDY